MHEKDKTKEQLVCKLKRTRQRIAELEKSEADRCRAEEALRRSEEYYRVMAETALAGITIADTDENLTFVNPAFAEMLGYRQEELVGMNLSWLTDETEFKRYREETERRKKGVRSSYETRLRCKDGSVRQVHVSASPITMGDGSYGGTVAVINDITEKKEMEEALKDSEERYRSMFNSSTDAFLIFDTDGNIIDANPASCRLYGYSYKELTKLTGKNLVHQAFYSPFEQLLKSDQSEDFSPLELVNVRKDGSLLNVEVKGTTFDYQGAPHLLTVIRDITDRKRAQEALKRSERELSIRNRIANIFLTFGDDQVYAEVLRVVLEVMESRYGFFGYIDENDDLVCPSLTRDVWDRCHMPGKSIVFPREKWSGIWGEALIQRKSMYSNEGLHVPEGHVPMSRALAVAIIHHEEILGELTVANRDRDYEVKDQELLESIAAYIAPILKARLESDLLRAKQKQAEDALRESEELHRTLIRAAPDPVVLIDLNRRLTFVSPRGVELLGYDSPEELLDRTILEFVAPEERQRVANDFEQAIGQEIFEGTEYILIRKDGSPFIAEVNSALIKDAAGKPRSFVAVVRDVTERKAAEAEKERMEAELRQSQKMEALGRLAGGVAHDFNNLLTTIRGYSDLGLMKAPQDTELHTFFSHINEASVRAAGLSSQLLLFGRRQPVAFERLRINKVILNLLNLLRRLIGENFSIVTDLVPEPLIIDADAGHIEQVIMNLVINAKDAMPEGGKITIRTENVDVDEDYCKTHNGGYPGKFVCVSVEDDGVGMDGTTLPHIFEPFFSTKGTGKGTGLGLSVVFGIVKEHGGWIDVESAPGSGSVFRVYIPSAAESPTKESVEVGAAVPPRGRGERVLVVEDEDRVREFAQSVFEQNGYIVFPASNLKEAVDIFTKEAGNFHLVFSDIVLPDGSGVKLVEHLKLRKPDLCVLLASGYADEITDWQAVHEKGYAFLQKPYVVADLLVSIRELLDRRQSRCACCLTGRGINKLRERGL